MSQDDSSAVAEELRLFAERLIAASSLIDEADFRTELESISTGLRTLIARLFRDRRRAARGQGARVKILAYLQGHLGEWVQGSELAAVSGIQEWARRVRELRVQEGYSIEEEGGRYRLLHAEPDPDAAAKWRIANEIRRRPGSARERILEYLTVQVGQVVTRDQLDYVARIKEGSRRVRELRDEFGWPIESHIDVAFLSPGQYRLLSADPEDRRDKRQRLYPENLRHRIFKRDSFTCQKCGRNRESAAAAGDTRFYLEVHHKTAVAEDLDALPPAELNDPNNLLTLCHRCHVQETAEFQRRRRSERTRCTKS